MIIRDAMKLRRQVRGIADQITANTGVRNSLQASFADCNFVTVNFNIGNSYMYSNNGVDFLFILRAYCSDEIARYASSDTQDFVVTVSSMINKQKEINNMAQRGVF